ncbi:MAG TPA: C4-dicarboxylate TRAP transporter substrate-binding protein [Xanthobacteraceae bacterium]
MRVLLAIALACGIGVAQVEAAEYKAATFVGPKHPIAKGGWGPYFKAVEQQSNGALKFRQFLAGSLLEAKGLLGGVRDGVADAAQVVLTYHPAEFPHGQLVADFALYGGDAMVAAAAVTEFNLFHCAPCLAEFKRNGIVYTGAFSTTPYVLMSKVKIATLADLKGKKMRTPGSVWDRWATYVGGTPVNLPANEMFEGLSRGILDIAIQAPAALKSYNLADAAKYLTGLKLGTYHSVAMLAFNPETWKKYSNGERKILLDNIALAIVGTVFDYYATDEEAISEAKSKRIILLEPDKSMLDDLAAFRETDRAVILEVAKSKYGIADPGAEFAKLLEIYGKWDALLKPIRQDRAKVTEVVKAELFDKLDPARYGME